MLRNNVKNKRQTGTHNLSPNDEEFLITTKANKSGANHGNKIALPRAKPKSKSKSTPDQGYEQQKLQIKSLQDKIQKAHNIITKYTRIQSQVQKYNEYLIDQPKTTPKLQAMMKITPIQTTP